MRNAYLSIGDYQYWRLSDCDEFDLDADVDYVLNRARLYRDRRDFLIQPGDTGKPGVYPVNPPKPLAG
ncbi:MAG: hypothetical protein OXL39_15060 [Caldilineaceae bacterium]|nr:hypothetical protein [Caldilineaceae bacterium]